MPLFAFAEPLVPNCGTNASGSQSPCGLCEFFLLIKNIFNFIALKLAPPMAALLIIVSGVLFLTSGGSERRVGQAKEIFKNLVIGLIIIYVSYLLVGTLINIIGKKTSGFQPQSWSTFKCL
jgi:hypothetical protein